MQYKLAFKPFEGSQCLALSCPCNEILYEGTRGPGKTAAQLARFRRLVGKGYGSFWRGVIFDIEYKNLADIITQSKRIFSKFNDGAVFLSSASELKWKWPTGEELLFRYEKNADGYWNYHGQEFPFIGHNELTKRPDSEFYESMLSCMRSSFRPEDYPLPDGSLLPPIPLECFSTANPFGVGHTWVKRRFIDPMPRGKVLRQKIEIPGIDGDAPTYVELTRVAIHGHWTENPFLDMVYIAFLMSIKDPNKKAAWVHGSWEITAGGRFDHLWNSSVHGIAPFKIPYSWHIDRSFDWGESKPFSVLWFAESDGTEATMEDGTKWCPPAGTVICIAEMYGCRAEEINKGLNMSSTNVAKMVKWVDDRLIGEEVEQPIDFEGVINMIPGSAPNSFVFAGAADNAINNKSNATSDERISIADRMGSQGVTWEDSDKSPGSRVVGAALLCDYLEAALEANDKECGLPERPALYFWNNVRGIMSRFPVLARDSKNPDDVDTEQEDHDYDALRYRVAARAQAIGMQL